MAVRSGGKQGLAMYLKMLSPSLLHHLTPSMQLPVRYMLIGILYRGGGRLGTAQPRVEQQALG